jgi:hypothetical protein
MSVMLFNGGTWDFSAAVWILGDIAQWVCPDKRARATLIRDASLY